MDMRQKLDESINLHLGPAAMPQDFPAEDLTPDLTYNDDTATADPEYGDAEVTPETGDNFLSAELMLPKGGVLVRGRVTAHKRNRDGNPVVLSIEGIATQDRVSRRRLFEVTSFEKPKL
jgi:hypothetical protein